jgi:AmmeMemoRadiSam system protein B
MSSLEKPKLRNVNAFPVEDYGKKMICLQDPLHFAENPVYIPENAFFIVSLFDGEHTILDIQEQFMRRYGNLIMSDQIRKVIEDLDNHLLLESERFEEYKRQVEEDFVNSSLRLAIHSGTAYDSSPDFLSEQMASYFTHPEGPGKINPEASSNELKGIVAPHIDYERGGYCYAWAYKDIAEICDADLFVILGTSHTTAKNAFILTEKDFQTPFGVVETNKDFVASVIDKYNVNLFEDELIHKSEHSIEFQVVFLQYILERDFEIVPVLCSSFQEMIEADKLPSDIPAISDFISSLKETISKTGRKVCFIASADLSHVGKRFGDQIELSSGLLALIESHDKEMLKHVEQLDADGFYASIQRDDDNRKICGLPSIYVMLKTMDATQGKFLKYGQAPDYNTNSVVSFASLTFN